MGTSGSGKSAIQHSLPIEFMTNCTTRPLRDGEVDGYHIKQVSEEEFLKLKEDGYFLETNIYAGNYYGTPKHKIDDIIKGKPYHCTKDINGVNALRDELGNRVVTIYIKPPSLNILKQRMYKRGDSEEDIEKRIKYLQDTNELDNERYADYIIVNNNLMEAQLEAHKIVIKELLNNR
jgi:guanylate kinase